MRATKRKTNRINFTKAAINALKSPTSGRTYVYDAKTPGLAVCVTSVGTKTFYLYRKVDGKPERIKIAPWPDITIEQARRHADRHNGAIASGKNPADKRRNNRNSPTFREIFDEFIDLPTRTRSKRPKAPKTIKDYRLQFDGYLAHWHDRQISKVTRADIEKLHNRLATASGFYAANRVLSLIKSLYNTAIDLDYCSVNPAARLRAFEEETRERFLTDEELPRFWKSLDAEPSEKVRDFVKLALFTGQRRGNVLAMRWDDLDLDRAIWTLPKTKTGKHVVPLTKEVVEILRRRLRDNDGSEYVLPGRHGKGHLKDPMRQWREILQRADLKDLRIHDLRRSLGSWQTITGASLTVVGKTLGHSQPSTTAIYARLSDDPVREAMGTATAAMMAATKPKRKRRKASQTKGGNNGKA
ncbi:MAG TPA: site-specific integrase [Pirellulaceae bacterium]|nr:site-specific integrase [Pirellulaceae bacterium]